MNASGVVTHPPQPQLQAPCVNCGNQPGFHRICHVCRQVTGLPVGLRASSSGKRFGGFLLDLLLLVVTLFIGYLIWSLCLYRGGRTPAKQLLGMRVIKTKDYRPSGFWRMYWRETVKGWLLYVFPIALWMIWDKDKQEPWDKAADTICVDWPKDVLVPSVTPSAHELYIPAQALAPAVTQPGWPPTPGTPQAGEAPPVAPAGEQPPSSTWPPNQQDPPPGASW